MSKESLIARSQPAADILRDVASQVLSGDPWILQQFVQMVAGLDLTKTKVVPLHDFFKIYSCNANIIAFPHAEFLIPEAILVENVEALNTVYRLIIENEQLTKKKLRRVSSYVAKFLV